MTFTPKALLLKRVSADASEYEEIVLDAAANPNKILKINPAGDLIFADDDAGAPPSPLFMDQGNIIYVNGANPDATDDRSAETHGEALDDNDIFKPFSTIGAALEKAAAGKLVVVAPYQYQENLQIRDGNHLYFDNGASVIAEDNDQPVLMFESQGSGHQVSITGKGQFIGHYFYRYGKNVSIECKSIHASEAMVHPDDFNSYEAGSKLDIKAEKIESAAFNSPGNQLVHVDCKEILGMFKGANNTAVKDLIVENARIVAAAGKPVGELASGDNATFRNVTCITGTDRCFKMATGQSGAQIKFMSGYCNKPLLGAGATNPINSPLLVVDKDVT